MKIERRELENKIKILKTLKLPVLTEKTQIVFPIDFSHKKDIDGIELSFVDNKYGSEKTPEPCLIVKDGKAILAYCDTTFARKFEFVDCCNLLGQRLKKKTEEELKDLDCFLIDSLNILIEFGLDKK